MLIPKYLRTHLRSALRKIWMYYSEDRKAVLNKARQSRGRYLCASCHNIINKLEVNHKDQIGSFETWEELGIWCSKLFVDETGLEAICAPCHQEITNKQRADKKKLKPTNKKVSK